MAIDLTVGVWDKSSQYQSYVSPCLQLIESNTAGPTQQPENKPENLVLIQNTAVPLQHDNLA